MARILGINGIRTDGSTSTDILLRNLRRRGHVCHDINYPKVNAFQARSRSRQRYNAGFLLDEHNHKDILIAHSYGCLLGLRAMEMGALFSHVFFFAPAMNRDFTFPHHGMDNLTVICNFTDQAIKWGARLWFGHDFGKMGSHGYDGPPDNRIENTMDNSGDEGERNHSHYFFEHNIDRWANYIEQKIGV